MKKIMIIILLLLFIYPVYSKYNVNFFCYNTGSICKTGPKIWLFDSNNDNLYDLFLFTDCKEDIVSTLLLDISTIDLQSNVESYLIDGNMWGKNFIILIFDPDNDKYICRLFYNTQLKKTVLEDYTQNKEDPAYFEEADNYFYFRQVGSYIFMTKKAELDIQSITLCNLSGIVLDKLTNTYSVGEFYFDLGNNPAGLYLIRIITNDKQLTKKMVYLK